jgi:hypothetical protein
MWRRPEQPPVSLSGIPGRRYISYWIEGAEGSLSAPRSSWDSAPTWPSPAIRVPATPGRFPGWGDPWSRSTATSRGADPRPPSRLLVLPPGGPVRASRPVTWPAAAVPGMPRSGAGPPRSSAPTMGRPGTGGQPFRFLWNRSRAGRQRLHDALSPGPLQAALARMPDLGEVLLSLLQGLDAGRLMRAGRVYGGGCTSWSPESWPGRLPGRWLPSSRPRRCVSDDGT